MTESPEDRRDEAVLPDHEQDEVVFLGSKLRDAAVDPRQSDFLPPTNAGEAHPHSRLVVAPGIHASAPGPIAPGPVSKDADEQQAKETALAEAVFVDGTPVPEATRAAADVEGEPGGASARAVNGTSDTTGPTKAVPKTK